MGTCLVQKAVGDDLEAAVRDLMEILTPQRRLQWAEGAVKDWANESFALTERTETRYCKRQDTTCLCQDVLHVVQHLNAVAAAS